METPRHVELIAHSREVPFEITHTPRVSRTKRGKAWPVVARCRLVSLPVQATFLIQTQTQPLCFHFSTLHCLTPRSHSRPLARSRFVYEYEIKLNFFDLFIYLFLLFVVVCAEGRGSLVKYSEVKWWVGLALLVLG